MEFIEQKWETVNKLFRSFRAVFEAKKGKHSKCPRCKGSGLLSTIGQSCWQQGHVPNEPCWFCEGVGVLPIVGLKGFILARASSHINTHDLMVQSLSPSSLETSLVNIGTRCKIITYKPVEEECMTFSFVAKTLPWLADFEREAELNNADFLPNHVLCGTQDSLSSSAQVKNKILFSTEWPSVIDSSQMPDKSHHANLNSITQEALDISKPYTDIQPQPFTASLLEIKCSLKHRQSNKGKIVGQVEEELDESKCLHSTSSVGRIPALNVFLIVSALKFAIQGKGLCQPTCPYNDSIFTESGIRASIQFDVELPTFRHAKIHKKARRGRNRIREKAQKEANESAQRILKHLTPRETNMSITPPNEIPEGVWSIVSTAENEAKEIHVRSETSKRLPLFRFQHAQSIMDRVYAYNNLWMKSFHFQKDTGLTFTKPARTLKN